MLGLLFPWRWVCCFFQGGELGGDHQQEAHQGWVHGGPAAQGPLPVSLTIPQGSQSFFLISLFNSISTCLHFDVIRNACISTYIYFCSTRNLTPSFRVILASKLNINDNIILVIFFYSNSIIWQFQEAMFRGDQYWDLKIFGGPFHCFNLKYQWRE